MMVFQRFLRKAGLCLCLYILINASSCAVLKDDPASGYNEQHNGLLSFMMDPAQTGQVLNALADVGLKPIVLQQKEGWFNPSGVSNVVIAISWTNALPEAHIRTKLLNEGLNPAFIKIDNQ